MYGAEPMRVAILGTRRMGSLRARVLGGRHEVVLAGGDAERTRRVAAEVGARETTVEEALGSSPDAVVIASATDKHAEHIRAAAALGVPVLCEKPLALTVEQAREAVDALAGVPAQVGFQRRFDAGLQAARAADVGTVYSIRITDRDASVSPEHFIPGSGGMFRDMHVHDFDLARWLTGREVARVYAAGTVRKHERYARHGDVDTSAIVLTMDDGVLVTIDGTRHDPRGQDVRVEIAGSEDVVAAGLSDQTPLRGLDGWTPSGAGWESSYMRFADAFVAETEAFMTLVRERGESPCSPLDALAALEIAVACDRSRETGLPVDL
jgi:myo-inositol 2-dehydrogenase / D-chiro-inositol 1-dehydrogenase